MRVTQEKYLQALVLAAYAAGAVRRAAGQRIGRNAVRAAGLSDDPPAQVHAAPNRSRSRYRTPTPSSLQSAFTAEYRQLVVLCHDKGRWVIHTRDVRWSSPPS